MKVTFIQSYYNNVWDALGLGYIIAYCKKHYKDELEINFFQGKFDKNSTIIDGAKDSDIVAFSCTSPAYSHGIGLARIIKALNPKVHIVFGGWHPTALPMAVLREDCVDQVLVGEGEHAFLEILNGKRFSNRILPSVVKYHLSSLQDHPCPDREAIRVERTIEMAKEMTGYRIASFQAHRGCPFRCPFCAEKIMSGKYHKTYTPIRTKDVIGVLDEIESVRDKYNIDYFKFVDPTFDVNVQYVINFCKLKIERGNVLEWEALIHASLATEEMFYWLKKAQCHQVNIGCESGSDAILKDIKKGMSTDIIKRVFCWAKMHGVKRRAFFLLGMPNETRKDIELTEKLIDEIKPDVVGFTILAPYPGTSFYDHEKYKDVNWSPIGEYDNDIWFTKHFTNNELKAERDRLVNKYKNIICEAQK